MKNQDAESAGVSQKEHDQLCTGVVYNPWTLVRAACDQPATRHLGEDTRDRRQFRFCPYHWHEFEHSLGNAVIMNPDPAWQWIRDHVINSTVSHILARVLKEGRAKQQATEARRQAGQEALAHIIKGRIRSSDVVYFVQAGDDGPIKIGTTRDLPTRINGLQVASPVPLHLRAFQPGDRKVEQQYHELFSLHRLGGEWFEPIPQLLATIEALAAQSLRV